MPTSPHALLRRSAARSRNSIPPVDPQIRPRDVRRRIRQQKCHRPHQVGRRAHAPLGDERGPLALEGGLVVEDFFGSVLELANPLFFFISQLLHPASIYLYMAGR